MAEPHVGVFENSALNGILYESWPQPAGGVRLVFISEGADQLLEATENELVAAIANQTLPLVDTDVEDFYRQLDESNRTQRPWSYEFGYRTPTSGITRWLRVQKFPRHTPDGTPYYSGVILDISAHRRAEHRARQAHRILFEHMNNTPLGVIEWDASFRVIRWSGRAEQIFGWAAEQVLGKTPDDWRIVHDDDRERVSEVIRELMTFERPHNFCFNRNYRKDGKIIQCEWHNSVVFDDSGNVSSILSLVQDVTERENALADLSHSEDRLRTSLQFANLLGWVNDLTTGTTEFTSHFGHFFGMPNGCYNPTREEQVLVIHPEDLPRVIDIFTDCLANTNEIRAEFRGAYPDAAGQTRHFLLQGSIVRDSEQRPTQILGVTTDITRQKREELERRLMEKSLEEAETYETLGMLAGNTAHDMNNLLTVILGNAALVRVTGKAGHPNQHELLKDVESAALRAAEFCQQLAAFAGRGRFVLRTLDLSKEIQEIISTLPKSPRELVVRYDLKPGLPKVTVEPAQLRLLISNLLKYATESFKEISDRQAEVTIATDAVTLSECPLTDYVQAPRNGPHVLIRVSHRGRAMTTEELRRVRAPFLSTEFLSVGLGLAAVRGIARGHKGGLRIVSQEGHGTTVEVMFPVEVTTPESQPAAALSDTPLSRGPETKKRKVLIVDDEKNVRNLMASLMEDEGFEVVTSENGAQGLQDFQDAPTTFNLALVDMLMPGMTGADLIRQLRSIRPSLPIIVVTGHVDRELVMDLSRGGRTFLLTKPFRFEQLTKIVNEAMTTSA